MTWLYWLTSVARAVCDTASGTVGTTAPPAPPPSALALMLIASSAVGAIDARSAGDRLGCTVVGRREGQIVRAGDRSRQVDARHCQRRVELVESLDGRRLGRGIEGRGSRADGDRHSGARRIGERVNTTVELAGREVGGSRRTCGGDPGARAGECNAGLGAVARRLLQRLVGDRLGGIDQLLQRGDAGVGGLQHLHAVADAVEQIADIAGAGIEAGRGEVVGRVVERAVDLLAGGEAGLRGREQVGGALQREQVLADGRRQDDIGHIQRLPQVCVASDFSRADGLHDFTRVRL